MHYLVLYPSSPGRWLLLSIYLSYREARLGFRPSLQDHPRMYGLCPVGASGPASGRETSAGAGRVGECFSKGEFSSTECSLWRLWRYTQLLCCCLFRRACCHNTAPSQSLPPPTESLPSCLLPVQTCPAQVSLLQALAPCC